MRNYIVLPKNKKESDYSEKMLLNCRSAHLLELSVHHMDGQDSYYYDAGGYESLKNFAEERALNSEEISMLFMGMSNMLSELSEYLLKPERLLLSAEYIMIGADGPGFCYYPEEHEKGGDFTGLAEYLLQMVDHEDEAAVKMVYDYYELVCEGIQDPGGVVAAPMVFSENEYESENDINIAEDILAEGQGNEDTAAESFYFREQEEALESLDVNSAVKPLAIACVVILLLGGIYIFLFLNQEILSGLGVEKSDYIVAAAMLCGILALMAALLIHRLKSLKER